jgi:hypothetical protein
LDGGRWETGSSFERRISRKTHGEIGRWRIGVMEY